jgi:hypothetical protein
MISIKKSFGICISLVIVCFTFSCQKPNNNIPAINSPLVVLTPSSDSGYAGDQKVIDYSTTAANGIKRIQIYTQFLSNPKVTAKDSTLATTKLAEDLNFDYTIPDSALRGQQTVITFVITDGQGNATTKTATITVTGSRPSIKVTPTSTSANKGDTITFNIVMKSPDKYIQTLDVSQLINSGAATSLPSVPYSGNQLVVSTIYKYGVPTSVNSGDNIDLLFTVVNSSGITNFTNATIKVN